MRNGFTVTTKSMSVDCGGTHRKLIVWSMFAELGVTGRAVGVVNGHNYSRGDDVSLTVYAPSGSAAP